MAERNNPFNENVNRLFELLNAGGRQSKSSRPSQESYKDEPIRREKNHTVKIPEVLNRVEEVLRIAEKCRRETQKILQVTKQMKEQTTGRNPSAPVDRKASVHHHVPQQYRVEESLDHAPERIRECKQLAYTPEGYRMSKEELFYRQCLMMADYEDDQPFYGDFTWYFPTYQAMNIAQLRGYFTWRAAVRRGQVERTSLSYVFVYIYELLHRIGSDTAEEGYHTLYDFWQTYRELDSQLDRYMSGWLSDYVIYYNLDKSFLEKSADARFDEALLVFLYPEKHTGQEYFRAILELSTYNMEHARFYKDYPEDVCAVTCAVFRDLTDYYAKHGKKTFAEKYFGTLSTCAYQMFASAVFYDKDKREDYEYIVNDIHRYRCKNGRWECEKYYGNRTKSKDLGFILRAIDCRMRERYEYKSPLQPDGMTKLVMNFIDKEIDRYLEEKKKNAVPVIEIDVSKLSGIRKAAAITQEKLLEEEDGNTVTIAVQGDADRDVDTDAVSDVSRTANKAAGDDESRNASRAAGNLQQDILSKQAQPTPEAMPVVPSESSGPSVSSAAAEYGLSGDECTLLRLLLAGQPYEEFLRGKRLMLSVAVDNINEKLYDCFGDTVILFDGNEPELIEDYAEEIKRMIAG